MTRDPRHDILFEPVQIGPKTLRNRFVQVPHCSGYGSERPGAQASLRAMKAEGGWALVSTEFCSIDPESDASPHVAARLWDDDDIANLAHLCEEVHDFGALAAVELWHGGAHAEASETRQPPSSPSQIPSDLYYMTTPRVTSLEDIYYLKTRWVAAARRARDAGFDVVYVYGSHGYLLGQFLSPFYNKRTDGYGGSFENRARLWLEVLEQVRSAVGETCAIACRISVEALSAAGVGLEEGLRFVELAEDLVDLWDVNIGSSLQWHVDMAPSRLSKENWQAPWTNEVKRHTSKPVVGVGRLVSPDTMVQIVRSGQLDLIGAARPSIADPFLPKKIDEGRVDDIRECIGCNMCIARVVYGLNLVCTQNATAGEEFRRGWHPERFNPAKNADSDVLVVGAGAAGMECALVLGKRGMRRVHLVDAEQTIGGYVGRVATLPGLGEWARLVNYRKVQLDKLPNVEVLTNYRLGTDDVIDYGADIVVLATGARWAKDGLNPLTHESIPIESDIELSTPDDILDGRLPRGERVLVYDCDGYFMGAGVAELLAREGRSVSLVSPLQVIAPYTDRTSEGPELRRQLHALGVALHAQVQLLEASGAKCRMRHEYGDESVLEVDAVVLCTARQSNSGLYEALLRSGKSRLEKAGVKAVYSIGDCVAPRMIADCIFGGHRLAREIDSPHPERPLPYLRERRVWPRTWLSADGAARATASSLD